MALTGVHRAAPAPPGTGLRNRDAWLASLERLFAVPPGYRDEIIDRPGALDILGCGDEILDELIRSGLPCSGEAGAERFDRHDLVNLGLNSGIGETVPEKTMRFAMRWMAEDPRTLFRPKRWEFAIELSCAAPAGCGGGGVRWSIARPAPQLYGGWVESLACTPAGPAVDELDFVSPGGPSFAVDAVLVTNGEHRELRSARLREILSEYSGGGYRWARLPEPLQWKPELVLPYGVAPCISVCVDLAAKCRAAGYEARTRRGWILGMLDLAHSWLEVVDDDGAVKTVDPVFGILAEAFAEPHPDFAAACFGSALNRVLPTEHAAHQPLLGHVCAGVPSTPRTKAAIQVAAEQPGRHEQPGRAGAGPAGAPG